MVCAADLNWSQGMALADAIAARLIQSCWHSVHSVQLPSCSASCDALRMSTEAVQNCVEQHPRAVKERFGAAARRLRRLPSDAL